MLRQQMVLKSDRSSWNIVLEQFKCVGQKVSSHNVLVEQFKCVGQKAWLVKKSYLNLLIVRMW